MVSREGNQRSGAPTLMVLPPLFIMKLLLLGSYTMINSLPPSIALVDQRTGMKLVRPAHASTC